MYIVKIYNDGIATEIHGEKSKLKSGSLVKAPGYAINSFSFTLIPSNPGFDKIRDYRTLVTIFNTRRNRYEFHGRVLYSCPIMETDGRITKEVICESFFGFLCDSKQKYVQEKNWTVTELWSHIISVHNEQVEEHKHFALGEIQVQDTNDNLYLGVQRETTWQTIKTKLIDKLGGEIRFRVVDGVTYIDHLEEIGAVRTTKIAVSHNMKSIRQDNDPTTYISRLIPLGAKLKDEEGNETEDRLDITSVNDGLDYIEDADAMRKHGIRVEHVYFDDVTVASNLKRKGEEFLRENNRVKVKYSITNVDLSLLGIDIDDVQEGDYYPIVNELLNIDDVARVTKKTIDVCNEVNATIEVGDKFKTLSDIQAEQSGAVSNLQNTVGQIEGSYVPREELISETESTQSAISQTADSILLAVSDMYARKTTLEEFSKTITAQLELLANELTLKFTQTETQISNLNGDLQSKFNQIVKYFTFDIDGFTIGQANNPNKIVIDNDNITIYANGVSVQEFNADGTALIPILKITRLLDILGLQITEDETNINIDYVG